MCQVCKLFRTLKNSSVTEPNLGSLTHLIAKSIYWHWVVVKESVAFTCQVPSMEVRLVNSRDNQPWIFSGRTDAEAPTLWPPDVKSWPIGKHPDSGKAWGQEEKGVTEDEMVGWHHWVDGHEFEQTLGVNEGQGSLACCSSWGPKESYMT